VSLLYSLWSGCVVDVNVAVEAGGRNVLRGQNGMLTDENRILFAITTAVSGLHAWRNKNERTVKQDPAAEVHNPI